MTNSSFRASLGDTVRVLFCLSVENCIRSFLFTQCLSKPAFQSHSVDCQLEPEIVIFHQKFNLFHTCYLTLNWMLDCDNLCLTPSSWFGLRRKVASELFTDGSDQNSTPEKGTKQKVYILIKKTFDVIKSTKLWPVVYQFLLTCHQKGPGLRVQGWPELYDLVSRVTPGVPMSAAPLVTGPAVAWHRTHNNNNCCCCVHVELLLHTAAVVLWLLLLLWRFLAATAPTAQGLVVTMQRWKLRMLLNRKMTLR